MVPDAPPLQGISPALDDTVGSIGGAVYNRMKLLLILLVAMAACAAPDLTVPVPTTTPTQAASQAITGADVASYRTQEDKGIVSDRTQEDVIDLSPSKTVSSIHADVGDRVFVQVRVPFQSRCTDLKVRDPFGNVIVLAPEEIRSDDGDFVQFRGAFFAAAAGNYLVDLEIDSENLRCGGVAPRRAEVKWTVDPH